MNSDHCMDCKIKDQDIWYVLYDMNFCLRCYCKEQSRRDEEMFNV